MSIHVTGVDADAVTEAMDAVQPPEYRDDAAPGSMLSRLRVAAEAQQDEKMVDIPVGGEFRDWLQIRYQILPPEHLDKFLSRRMNEETVKYMEANMDFMAQACIAVVGYNPETDEREVLQNEDGRPVRLNHDLAELLEFPVPDDERLTARDVIMLIFGRNGIAIGAHSDKVVTWMQNPVNEEVDLGEE